jgi:hypothetical protein
MSSRAMHVTSNCTVSLVNRRILLARRSSKDITTNRQLSISSTQHICSPVRFTSQMHNRPFSSLKEFKPQPPETLTAEIAEGILDLTQFYCRFGISGQRLKALADVPDLPIIERWQEMMEVYVTTQIHVIAGLGYDPNAEGLNLYAHHLSVCIHNTDETMKELFAEVRRDTWREIVGTVFKINPKDIPILSIVDARELMHKVSSKMIEPDTLLGIQSRTANVRHENQDIELQMKHKVLQQILVEDVYLGGNPSLVEEAGFGTGGIAYAKIQCALSDHEGDPLMANYASSAMVKILSAAGIEVDSIQGPGLSCNPV